MTFRESIIHFSVVKKDGADQDERSGQQFAAELQWYIQNGVGKWKSVRVIHSAFDIEGKSIKGMVALVGVPKE